METRLQRTPSRTLSDSSQPSFRSVSLTHLPRRSKSLVDLVSVTKLPASCDNGNDSETAYSLQLNQQQATRQSVKALVCEEDGIAPLSNQSIFRNWHEKLISATIGLICIILVISILLYIDNRSMRD
jgi:hypothetical protein